jgi:hypothetical protein
VTLNKAGLESNSVRTGSCPIQVSRGFFLYLESAESTPNTHLLSPAPTEKDLYPKKKNNDDSSSKEESGCITAVCILSFVLLMMDRHHSFLFSFDSFPCAVSAPGLASS